LSGSAAPHRSKRPAQLILTIGYTRAALTVPLVVEECGIFEYRRVLHSTRLGVDGLSEGSDSSRDDLGRALRNVTNLPLEDGNGADLKQISNLILLGESAGGPAATGCAEGGFG
jgi:hypothetical protein